MLEAFTSSIFFTTLLAAIPSITAILSLIISALLILHKVGTVINEFRASNDLAELNKANQTLLNENAQLYKKVNEYLELSKGIHQTGWTDDKFLEE